MTCWAIIPAKEVAQAKQRLAGVLDPQARARLAEAMLAHVVRVVQAARGIDQVVIVGPAGPVGAPRASLLDDPGLGLNVALAAALAEVSARGATRAVIIAADLPQLTVADVEDLARLPQEAMAIAPDRHGAGTNALSLPLPAARGFAFAFGPGSCELHRLEAGRLGMAARLLNRPGLARDIDLPEDLSDAAGFIDTTLATAMEEE